MEAGQCGSDVTQLDPTADNQEKHIVGPELALSTLSESPTPAGSLAGLGDGDPIIMTGPSFAHSSNKQEMYGIFQSWALQNYGDSGKTKTVTLKKYNRIVRTLAGEEQPNSENSKFRFWVKAKGFKLGPPPPDEQTDEDQVLYVPTKIVVSKVFMYWFINVYTVWFSA